jgi:hypothetical protein
MTTDRTVNAPPSKSRSRQEYTSAPQHVHRDDIHEAFLTLACAIICWRRTAEPSGYQPAGHDYQHQRMRTQARQT